MGLEPSITPSGDSHTLTGRRRPGHLLSSCTGRLSQTGMNDQEREGSRRVDQQFERVREAVAKLFEAGQPRKAAGLLEEFLREWPEHAGAHEQLGIAFSDSGDHTRALKAFETAARLDSGSAAIRHNMGIAFRQAGQLLKAAESFAEAIRLDGKSYSTWLARAEILTRLGDYPGACEAAQTAASMCPKEERPCGLLVLLKLLEGDFPAVDEAVKGYRARAGELAHLFPRLQKLVGPDMAVDRAKIALARRGILAREAALFLGEHHYREEQPDTAIAYLLDARSLGAEDATTLMLLSRAYMQRGRTAEAETAVRLATTLEPQNRSAWNEFGNLLGRLGKDGEAVEAHRAATRIAPTDGTTWYNLGVALVRTGQCEEAIKVYREAIRLGPESSRASNNLGSVLLSLGRDLEAQRAFADAVFRYDPNNGRALGNLGLLLAQRGNRETAIRTLRAALKLRPERTDLAIALLELEAEKPPPFG